MELLLPAAVTLLTQLLKWFAEKVGVEKAKDYTLLAVLILSVVGTLVWKTYEGQLDWGHTEQIISVMGLAIGYYEVVIKRLITPVFNKLTQ